MRVIGAGASCVNGLYKRSNMELNGWPVYTMKGVFRKTDVLFSICKTGNGWYISAPGDGRDEIEGSSNDIDFYKVISSDDLIPE